MKVVCLFEFKGIDRRAMQSNSQKFHKYDLRLSFKPAANWTVDSHSNQYNQNSKPKKI